MQQGRAAPVDQLTAVQPGLLVSTDATVAQAETSVLLQYHCELKGQGLYSTIGRWCNIEVCQHFQYRLSLSYSRFNRVEIFISALQPIVVANHTHMQLTSEASYTSHY